MYVFYEDWNDDKFSRDTAAIIALGGKLNNAGGRIIPRTSWTITTGTVSVSGGVVTLTPSSAIRSARAYPFNPNKTLRWEYRGRSTYPSYYPGIPYHALRITIIGADENNRWTAFGPNLYVELGNSNALWKCVNGSWTIVKNVYHNADTNWHVISGKRYPGGTWEIFYDGVSDGTVVDTWLPSGNNYIWISNDFGNTRQAQHNVELDYFKIWEE